MRCLHGRKSIRLMSLMLAGLLAVLPCIQAEAASSSRFTKEETVYVSAEADGSVREIIVSDWLQNPQGESEIPDVSTLKDIVNVKGDETYTESTGNVLNWQANGEDIYYQGTTDKELPVSIKVSYTLDGKSISPDKLAGESGHVKIRFEYENNAMQTVTINGEEEEIATPFTVISGMMLPTDRFHNVKVSNGRVISTGGNYMAVGTAFPGLADSLSLDDKYADDVDLPDYVEISADTTDFELAMTMTIVSSDALSGLKVDKLTGNDDLRDMQGSLDELSDASKELTDGTGELKKGTKKLTDGTGELADGIREYTDGVGKLADGIDELNKGTGALGSGVDALSDGASKLLGGFEGNAESPGVVTGARGISDGLEALLSGEDSLLEGLKSGSSETQAALALLDIYRHQIAADRETIASLNSGADSSAEALSSMEQGIASLNAAYAMVVQGLSASLAGAQQAAQAEREAAEALRMLAAPPAEDAAGEEDTPEAPAAGEQTGETVTWTVEWREQSKPAPAGDTSGEAASSAEANPAETPLEETPEENAGETVTSDIQDFAAADAVPSGETTTPGAQEETSQVEQIRQMIHGLHEAVGAWSGASAAAGDAMKTAGASIAAAGEAAKSAETDPFSFLSAYGDALSSYTAALSAMREAAAKAVEPNVYDNVLQSVERTLGTSDHSMRTLTGGVGALREGTVQLRDGSKSLADGLDELGGGIRLLAGGLGEFRLQIPKLLIGIDQLTSGATELRDASSELSDGADELERGIREYADGVDELNDGMVRFDEEGIQELVDSLDLDTDTFFDRLDAIEEAGKNYDNFSGLGARTDGTVQFVIRTEGIEKED